MELNWQIAIDILVMLAFLAFVLSIHWIYYKLRSEIKRSDQSIAAGDVIDEEILEALREFRHDKSGESIIDSILNPEESKAESEPQTP